MSVGFPRQYGTAMYPVHDSQSSNLLKRSEPMLTPAMLKSRYLKGVPLTFPNGDTFTDQDFQDQINLAMNEAELLIGVTITPEERKEKHPFDRSLYQAYIHIKAEHGPIMTLSQLAIVSASDQDIFEIPADWIETANFTKRLINVIPLLSAYGVNTTSSAGSPGNVVAGGTAFLMVLSGLSWVPAYWQITYVTGLSKKPGQLPVPVNDLIGAIAAINILSLVASSNIFNSQSLSQDGISQSSSGPGPNVYKPRIEDLLSKRDELVKKLKAIFSSKFFTSNI